MDLALPDFDAAITTREMFAGCMRTPCRSGACSLLVSDNPIRAALFNSASAVFPSQCVGAAGPLDDLRPPVIRPGASARIRWRLQRGARNAGQIARWPPARGTRPVLELTDSEGA